MVRSWNVYVVLTVLLVVAVPLSSGSWPSRMTASPADDDSWQDSDLESPSPDATQQREAREFSGEESFASVGSLRVVVDDGIPPVDSFDIPDFSKPVVKEWKAVGRRLSASSASSVSTAFSDDDEQGVLRSSPKSWVSDLLSLEKIKVLRFGQGRYETVLSGCLSVRAYIESCELARKNILACYSLLTEYRELFSKRCDMRFPRDDRMERCEAGELVLPEKLQVFKHGYDELYLIYSAYMRFALELGLGIPFGPAQKRAETFKPDFSLAEPARLGFGICSECKAEWRSKDFVCLNCGEFMLSIPEEKAGLFKASCDLSWLVKHSHFFCDVANACLRDLEDLDGSCV